MLFSNPAFSQPDLKIIFMGILEFGAYFLASAVGLDLSLSLFINLDNPFSTILESLNDGMYAYILIIIFLFMGAFLETSSLKNKLGDLPLDADFDLEELKKQALQKLKGKGIILTLFFQQ